MNKKLKNRGFTLIEALVAIAILIVSIIGPMTIASKGIASAIFAKDQITAFYLAQEAIEYIRNKRDGNSIKGEENWLAGLDKCRDGKVCTVDIVNNRIESCTGDCEPLKYDSDTNFYNYSIGDDSKFTREVKLTKINDNEEAVTATLSWDAGFLVKTFTVKEHMLDWQ